MHRKPFFSAMTYLPTVALFYFLFFFAVSLFIFISYPRHFFRYAGTCYIQVATTPGCTKRYLGIVFCCTGYYKKK